jgi:hypothetical protein
MVDLPSLPVAEVTKIVLGGLSIFENNRPVLIVLILSAKGDRESSRYCISGLARFLLFLTTGVIPNVGICSSSSTASGVLKGSI